MSDEIVRKERSPKAKTGQSKPAAVPVVVGGDHRAKKSRPQGKRGGRKSASSLAAEAFFEKHELQNKKFAPNKRRGGGGVRVVGSKAQETAATKATEALLQSGLSKEELISQRHDILQVAAASMDGKLDLVQRETERGEGAGRKRRERGGRERQAAGNAQGKERAERGEQAERQERNRRPERNERKFGNDGGENNAKAAANAENGVKERNEERGQGRRERRERRNDNRDNNRGDNRNENRGENRNENRDKDKEQRPREKERRDAVLEANRGAEQNNGRGGDKAGNEPKQGGNRGNNAERSGKQGRGRAESVQVPVEPELETADDIARINARIEQEILLDIAEIQTITI